MMCFLMYCWDCHLTELSVSRLSCSLVRLPSWSNLFEKNLVSARAADYLKREQASCYDCMDQNYALDHFMLISIGQAKPGAWKRPTAEAPRASSCNLWRGYMGGVSEAGGVLSVWCNLATGLGKPSWKQKVMFCGCMQEKGLAHGHWRAKIGGHVTPRISTYGAHGNTEIGRNVWASQLGRILYHK
jgi:hypothetical protein